MSKDIEQEIKNLTRKKHPRPHSHTSDSTKHLKNTNSSKKLKKTEHFEIHSMRPVFTLLPEPDKDTVRKKISANIRKQNSIAH